MKILDEGHTLVLRCDRCQVPLKGLSSATVGLHGAELVAVCGPVCRASYQQFFLNTIDRELSLTQFAAELAAAV
jgi:hypothetical protein